MRREDLSPFARIAAAVALLDRGFGKPRQAVDDEAQPVKMEVEFVRTIVDPKARPEEAAGLPKLEDASVPLIEAPAVSPDV